MKKAVLKLAACIFSVTISMAFLLLIVIQVIPVQYDETFQYEINEKYDRLLNTNDSKIIITGGSATSFGLDQDIVESETKMPVVNTALHAGFGMPFQTEIVKGNINPGDVVILVYEYKQWTDLLFDAALVTSAIDNHIEMYKYIPVQFADETIKYMPTYASEKIDSFLGLIPVGVDESGTYCKSAFSNGDMILDRPACVLPYPITDIPAIIDLDIISPDVINYVNQFNKYVKDIGAILLISFPPVLDEGVKSNHEDILAFEKELEVQLDAPIISRVEDYVFSREYMFNTLYHCNNSGAEKRSYLLSADIDKYLENTAAINNLTEE